MPYPTISRYADTLSHPFGLFRTLGRPRCEKDVYGRPAMFAGGNAVVFRINSGGREYALKCFTKPVEHVRAVCRLLSDIHGSLTVRPRYLEKEIFVYGTGGCGEWYDVVLTEWVEGRTLEFEMRKALHDADRERLAELASMFDTAALELLDAEWAHGDLKPENIIIAHGGIKLIDYDSFFHPLLGACSNQTGTHLWQHPRRNEHYFNRHTDDYPIAMISATLHCLAEDPSLYKRFGNSDFYLFLPSAISEGRSGGYAHITDDAARKGNAPLHRLLETLSSPVPHIEGLPGILSYLNGRKTKHESGLYAFRKGSAWGYGDERGNTAIPSMFTAALEFSDGLAAVKTGRYNHYIDTSGNTVINCADYEKIKSFSEGLAPVCTDGKWGYIDRSGKMVIHPQYLKAGHVRGGKAAVSTYEGDKTLEILQ